MGFMELLIIDMYHDLYSLNVKCVSLCLKGKFSGIDLLK